MFSFRSLSRCLLACSLLIAPAAQAVEHIGPNCSLSSIQFALDTYPDETEFHIDVGTYAENLYINRSFDPHDIKLIGGYVGCSDDTMVSDPTRTVITAAGSNQSVVSVSGTVSPYFANLTLTGGAAPVGGGIHFEGTGWIFLRDVRISANAADKGGGIGVVPRDGPVVLNLNVNTLVSGNTAATLGGGVYVDGATSLLIGPTASLAYNTVTAGNTAGGGGGLAVVGPAHAHIGSIGFVDPASGITYGAVSHNRAIAGAGIKLLDGGIARLFSVARDRPTVIESNGDNDETLAGGGIGLSNDATLCGWGYALRDNRGSGAALSAIGSTVKLERTSMAICAELDPETAEHVDCIPGHACNRIEGNVGSSIVYSGSSLNHSASFAAGHVDIRGNTGSSYGMVYIDSGRAALYNCVLADNHAQSLLFWSGEFAMDGCTIARNLPMESGTPLNAFFAWSHPSLQMTRSIVWQPGAALLPRAPDTLSVVDVVASDAAALSGGTHSGITQANPLFVDETHGDYHLRRGSPAIDHSDAYGMSGYDLQMQPRCIELASAPHACDIGAYELQDRIFASGFEVAP